MNISDNCSRLALPGRMILRDLSFPRLHPAATLPSRENLLDARFKILLALGPHFQPIDWYCLFDAANPLQESTNIFGGFFLVIPQVFGPFHGFEEPFFLRALRICPLAAAETQQAPVPGEKMLESKVDFQVSEFAPESIVVILAIAENLERLRLNLPSPERVIVRPEIPARADFVGRVVVQVILRELDHAVGVEGHRPQILLENRRFGGIYGANHKIVESRRGGREGNRGEQRLKLLQNARLRKILAPDADVSVVGHNPAIIPASRVAPKNRQPKFATKSFAEI